MTPDFVDLLRAFVAADVRFLIVGAYALALHGRPRATGDLDVWVEPIPANAAKVMQALASFGTPLTDVSVDDFSQPAVTYQIGVAPGRIDIPDRVDWYQLRGGVAGPSAPALRRHRGHVT